VIEEEKISKALGVVIAPIGILVMVVPRYILPVCEYQGRLMETKMGMSIPMKCSWTAQSELGIGLVIIVAALALLLSKQAETRKMISLILVALGIVVVLLPTTLIGVCPNPMMTCHAGALPALGLLGGLLIIVAAIGIYTAKEK
jgi:hypothetical protein